MGVDPDLGWEYPDPADRTTSPRYYQVDRYFERQESTIPMWRDVTIRVPHYHRPLSDYAAALRQAGFLMRDIVEPAPDCELVAKDPQSRDKNRRIPYFLVVDAVRANPPGHVP